MKPVRVLYAIHGLQTGGTERLVSDLARMLDRRRFTPMVAAVEDGHFRDILQADGCRVCLIGHSKGGRARRFGHVWRELRRELARGIDVVHTHHLGMLLHVRMASLPRRRWGWVHTEHVRPELEPPDVYSARIRRLAPFLLRAPDAVTGVSDAVGEYFLREASVPPERVRVIYNGVDVERFAAPCDRAAKRQELGIPGEAWVIGTVANLRPQKNHALLVEAFAHLLTTVPRARLVLVGGGPLMADLRRQVDALGIADRVSLLGPRLDTPELLAMLDVYCLPSRYEGLPLSLLEAMAAGLPIVATRVLGISEIIRDEETGLLVPSEDAAALAKALIRLNHQPDLAAHLSARARDYVCRHGNARVMRDAYAELYERIAQGRRE
jgi:glycosyltransferase involved in cell wall biosynthesis